MPPQLHYAPDRAALSTAETQNEQLTVRDRFVRCVDDGDLTFFKCGENE
ncbi:MAG TPA: hypothetical protein VGU72_25635 [Beijerinckiaceae bacterium]|nr:hypothetical protein [Beijerinckiaceae bacterium]